MLTRKQQELLLYIHRHLGEGGVSPSFDEMKEALGLKSKSGIHRLITGLEERGFIRRLPHRARALEILRLPDSTTPLVPDSALADTDLADGDPVTTPTPAHQVQPRFKSNVIRPEFQAGPRAAGRDEETASEVVRLPLYGRIAAGLPIEALRDATKTFDMPAAMLGGGEHYALEVAGDSMVDAGIHDGDTVIIQRCEQADNGAIVVALVDNSEVTLKRLRRKNNSIALEAANPNYETRVFGADRVRVQGKLVGLFRRF